MSVISLSAQASDFWKGVFWGGVLSSATSGPSASQIVDEIELRKLNSEIRELDRKMKQDKKNFCEKEFFEAIEKDIKSGASPLLQIKHRGSLNVRYIFKNPKDEKDPLEVKVEDPALVAERAYNKKFHALHKVSHTFKVGTKEYRYLPASLDYYSNETRSKDKSAAKLALENYNSIDPQLRVFTASTSKGSITFHVLGGKIISIMNNKTEKPIILEPKTPSDITALSEAKKVFDDIADKVGSLEYGISSCTDPGSDSVSSDDHIRTRRKFFARLKETTWGSQAFTELTADANGIIPNPCINIKSAPFNKFYGFKIDKGYVVKFKGPNSEGKVHTGGNGKPIQYSTVAQFLSENEVKCDMGDQSDRDSAPVK